MSAELLTTQEAANRLGIERTTLYGWLGLARVGQFVIRGESVTIDYLQAGPRGQGKILITASEVQRLMDLMRVRTRRVHVRRLPVCRNTFPGITVALGVPD